MMQRGLSFNLKKAIRGNVGSMTGPLFGVYVNVSWTAGNYVLSEVSTKCPPCKPKFFLKRQPNAFTPKYEDFLGCQCPIPPEDRERPGHFVHPFEHKAPAEGERYGCVHTPAKNWRKDEHTPLPNTFESHLMRKQKLYNEQGGPVSASFGGNASASGSGSNASGSGIPQ